MTKMAAVGAIAAITIAACGSDDDSSSQESDTTDAAESSDAPEPDTTDTTEAAADETDETDDTAVMDEDAMEEGEAVDLSGVCPETIVIQTDWFPEAEHGALYQMVGENPQIDSGKKVVSGPLVTHGGAETGVNIEIRTGGPAIGFEQVVTTMAGDPDITFGYVLTDEAIENYADNPTTAFVAPLEINPQIIMWDPETYPDVESIADLATADGGDGVTIRYFETGAYMRYLVNDGQVTEAQLDGSYDGSPQIFISEGGAIAQQGFASAEPYNYENVFEDWAKPVDFELIHDAGWQAYAAPLGVLDSKKEELTDCMAAFTPVVQMATVDYYADPDAANELIIEAVNAYDDFWVYDQGLADFSVQAQLDLGLAGNGPDDVVGNFDEERLTAFIEAAGPVYGVEGLTVDDLVTNEYIDSSIGF
ncbi:ABC transporter substrate-binding protein [Ilumatobacter sp.]|uniref:ABC transporter substrate-binding protein n=1 Tax=Ilumatobacter sp. TaxID=1967498 RepID=UPI003C40E87B